jgi:hypothetical protein
MLFFVLKPTLTACSILLFSCILLAGQTRDLRLEPIDPATKRAFEKQVKVALVVGISAYPQGSGLSSLKYAARDAEVLGATLKSQGYLVRQLTESDATRETGMANSIRSPGTAPNGDLRIVPGARRAPVGRV